MSNIGNYNIDWHEANEGIILKWYKKTKEGPEYTEVFIYAWISFNALYYSTTKETSDEKSLEEFSQKPKVLEVWGKLKWDETFFNYIKNRPNEGIMDLKDRDNSIIKWIDMNDLAQYLKIIYQIRNNLFHGWKKWDDSDKYLIQKANESFLVFLEKLYWFTE